MWQRGSPHKSILKLVLKLKLTIQGVQNKVQNQKKKRCRVGVGRRKGKRVITWASFYILAGPGEPYYADDPLPISRWQLPRQWEGYHTSPLKIRASSQHLQQYRVVTKSKTMLTVVPHKLKMAITYIYTTYNHSTNESLSILDLEEQF